MAISMFNPLLPKNDLSIVPTYAGQQVLVQSTVDLICDTIKNECTYGGRYVPYGRTFMNNSIYLMTRGSGNINDNGYYWGYGDSPLANGMLTTTDTRNNSQNIYFFNQPQYPVLVPSVLKVNYYLVNDSYMDSFYTSQYVYPITFGSSASGDQGCIIAGSPIAMATWRANNADRYATINFNAYDNSDDGSYSASNPRTLAVQNRVYPFMDMYYSGLDISSDGGTWSSTPWANLGQVRINMINFFNPYINSAFPATLSGLLGIQSYYPSDNASLQIGNYVSANANTFTPLTKAELTSRLNTLGIPWTLSAEEATDYNSSDFSDYAPTGQPGQPDNPTGGGDGDGDNTTDTVVLESPSLSAIGAFSRQYAINRDNLNDVSNFLWTATFIDNIKLLFNSPMEAMQSVVMFPFDLYEHDSTNLGALTSVKIGNVDTNINAYPIYGSYDCTFDLGSFTVNEYFGSFLDYDPLTEIVIYLPYIGYRNLSTNEVMGKTISVTYAVDLTSGSCIAFVMCDGNLLTTETGQIGVQIPISASTAAQFATSIAISAASLVAGGLTAGAGIAASVGTGAAKAAIGIGAVNSGVAGIVNNKIHVSRGGSYSSMLGWYAPQKVHLFIKRPKTAQSSYYQFNTGYPSNVQRTLGDLTGFVQCDNPMLSGLSCTTTEKDMIYDYLTKGILQNE